MSQHSAAASTTTVTTSTTTNVTTTNSNSEEESSSSTSTSTSAKPGSSFLGSLKKQKHKDTEVTLTDDFVLMSTPDKFKDKNVNDCKVVKRQRSDSSPIAEINLECLLLSDTSIENGIPRHVEFLLQHFNKLQLSQAELLFLLVYIVALESGFANQTDDEQCKLQVEELTATSSFHAKNILHLSHHKPNYRSTEDKTRFTLKLQNLIDIQEAANDYLYALLTGFVTGDFLIITLTPAPKTVAKGFSTALSIPRYVLSMQTKNKPLYQRFRKLDELSYTLRDHLFVPMRCQQCVWLEYCIYPSLDGMPAELYDHILKYLNKNQLKILANVNKSLYNLTKGSKFYAAIK